jgi:hypothetical protein
MNAIFAKAWDVKSSIPVLETKTSVQKDEHHRADDPAFSEAMSFKSA